MPNRRKSPTRKTLPHQINEFKVQDEIQDFSLIDNPVSVQATAINCNYAQKKRYDALVVTLRRAASLVEELLEEGYHYVLTSRFQINPLELRFSKYRQMSKGRFLLVSEK